MKDLKKIEFYVTVKKGKLIDKIIKDGNFTYAELMRRALDLYILNDNRYKEDSIKSDV